MTSRRMLPVWILAGLVAVLVGILLVGWLRPRQPASFIRSASPTPSAGTPLPSPSRPASPLASAASLPPATSPTATPSPTPAPRVLLAVGDTASCDNAHDSAVADLAATLPGEIALVGDLAYPDGSASSFADCFDPVWGSLRDHLRPVPGNHEYVTPGASAYFAEFGEAGTPGQGWYAYEVGTWRVLALNSNCGAVGCGEGSEQLAWLRAELADAPACTLAYWHHPRYSSGMHGDSAFVEPLWSAAVAGRVDVVLGGHDHDYERLTADGIREFVVGTGGRSLYAWPGDPPSRTEARTDASYGLLELLLGSNTYSWRFIPADGDLGFTDSGTGACH